MRDEIRITYRIESAGNVEHLAEKIASDQSTGTFIDLPAEAGDLKSALRGVRRRDRGA